MRRLTPLFAASGLVLASLASLTGTQASASTPPSGALLAGTAPATARWTGTIPVGVDALSDCTATPGSTPDPHALSITVPAAVAKTRTVMLSVKISWTPTVSENTSDEILTLTGPDGKAISSSDTGNPSEAVSLQDPAPGTYTALACGSTNAQPQAYQGVATLTTTPKPTAASLPLAPSQGLQFAATVVSDPQRDEGEPATTVDKDGTIYTCGPSGFSNIADFAQVSTDGGYHFHLLGSPPRGQVSTAQGGGDCALAVGRTKNASGAYQLAYAGLGPLTNFSTATSADRGQSLAGSAISESVPGVDRQWIAFGSEPLTTYFTYNQQALNKVVQKSVDGGLTYDTPGVTAANEAGRIGQIRVIPKSVTGTQDFVYLPYSTGNLVKIALSQDSGKTFSQCLAVDAHVSPDAGFVGAINDSAGNVFVTYSEKGSDRGTYLSSIPFSKFKNCKGPNPTSSSPKNVSNPGFSAPIRLNRGDVRTTVMPWIAAEGAPGRVAVAYYGTQAVGNPDSGALKASWNVYVNEVLDALSPTPHVSQVQASTHPNHYDSICLNGLGCDLSVPAGDRSLVDYFTMEYSKGTGGLHIVYSQAAKRPGDASGVVAAPATLAQISGPSLGGGMVDHRANHAVLRQSSNAPSGDAFSNYSMTTPLTAVKNPRRAQVPALDLVGSGATPAVAVSPRKGGGFTLTLRLKDLSATALSQAMSQTTLGTPGSLVYAFRFFNGYRPAAAVAKYDALNGWTFGFSGYETQNVKCGGNTKDKCETYSGSDAPLVGKVDAARGTITLSVPLTLLKTLGNGLSTGKPYPGELPARAGSRVYDATAFTFVNDSPDAATQSFMQQVDNAPAMDFLVPAALGAKAPAPGLPPAGPPTPVAPPGGHLPFTGGAPWLALTGLVLASMALVLRRRRA